MLLLQLGMNDGKGADDQWIQYAKLAKAYKGGYIDLSVNPNPITAFGDVDDYVFMDTNWQDVFIWKCRFHAT